MDLVKNRREFCKRIGVTGIAVAMGTIPLMDNNAEASSDGPSMSPLKIGVIVDMSGPYADVTGVASVAAIKMAVADYGGKVLDRRIEVVAADHQNKPDLAASIARRWFDTEGVTMIAEVAGSAPALAVIDLANERKKVIVVSGPASSSITNKYCTPVSMHWSPDSHALTTGTVKGVIGVGKNKKWFLIAVDNVFGKTMEADAIKALHENGGELIGVVRHPLGTLDFSSYILQAQASGADVVALANAGADTINAIKSAQEFRLLERQKLTALFILINDVHALGTKATEGMILTDGFYWNRNKATTTWSERLFKQLGKMPNTVQAAEYSSVLHYLKSVAIVKSTDAGKVVREMKATRVNDGIYATNAVLREDGRLLSDVYLFQVKSPSESNGPWDVYKELKDIPGDDAYTSVKDSTCKLFKKST